MVNDVVFAGSPGSLVRAISIAVHAHAGVEDKAGSPYILHPLRVMMAVDGDLAKIVAVLHDVVEDGEDWSPERLAGEGFGKDVLDALAGVTKRPDEEDSEGDSPEVKLARYLGFVRRAGANPISRMVKLADLNDNLDVTRLAKVSEKDARRLSKYLEARSALLAM